MAREFILHPDISNKEWETHFGTNRQGCCNFKGGLDMRHTHATSLKLCDMNLRTNCKTQLSCPHTYHGFGLQMVVVVAAARCCFQVLLMTFKPFGEQRVDGEKNQ